MTGGRWELCGVCGEPFLFTEGAQCQSDNCRENRADRARYEAERALTGFDSEIAALERQLSAPERDL